MNENLPIVGITIGDVAGIGPEVVVKALKRADIYELCRPLVIGDARIFADPKFAAGCDQVRTVASLAEAEYQFGTLTVLDMPTVNPADVEIGQISALAGDAAVQYVLKATHLAMAGEIDAIATAPLNKEAMQSAGHHYIGHTEILAEVTETPDCTTMLATPGLRVTHVTRHVPFRAISDKLTLDSVLLTTQITYEGMLDLGYEHPRIAVAGLNPHNGEGGILGMEEIDVIAPAVKVAQEKGIGAYGPIPADSVFFQAIRGDYDVVVCMYHDQGHIAVKTHGFERSITITLGLPIVRTSADHGTAFDIAGRGIAHEDSMVEAIVEAARIATRRKARLGAES